MKKIACIAVGLMGLHAAAANWVKVAETGSMSLLNGSIVEVDSASIRVRDGIRQAWSRQSFFPPMPSTVSPGKMRGSFAALDLFDCKNDEFSGLQTIEYSLNYGLGDSGGSAANGRAESLRGMRSPVPGSVGAATLAYVCAHPLK